MIRLHLPEEEEDEEEAWLRKMKEIEARREKDTRAQMKKKSLENTEEALVTKR